MMKVLSTDADFKAKVLLAPHHPADSVGEVVDLADEMGDAAPAALPVGAAAAGGAGGLQEVITWGANVAEWPRGTTGRRID